MDKYTPDRPTNILHMHGTLQELDRQDQQAHFYPQKVLTVITHRSRNHVIFLLHKLYWFIKQEAMCWPDICNPFTFPGIQFRVVTEFEQMTLDIAGNIPCFVVVNPTACTFRVESQHPRRESVIGFLLQKHFCHTMYCTVGI